VRGSLVVAADGAVLGGVSEAAEGGREGALFLLPPPERHHKGGGHSKRPPRPSQWQPRPPQIEMLPAPIPNECVAAMAIDSQRNVVYGLSSESSTLFTVDPATCEVRQRKPVVESGKAAPVLVLDGRGNVYGAGPLGRLWRYDPVTDQVEHLGLRLPTVAGRAFYNQLDCAALDPASGLIYGAGSADGVLFVFDPEARTIRSLGKVMAEPRCRCITVGLDGRVYGVAGEDDGMGHLFCYDPAGPELRDLGIPYTTSERVWHGYEFQAACTGPNGEIYLGESDRISHLFIYFPPIRPAAAAPKTA